MTLVQTKKVTSFPIVLLGSAYWQGLLEWLRTSALAEGMIRESDLDLLTVTDDPAVAVKAIIDANGPIE